MFSDDGDLKAAAPIVADALCRSSNFVDANQRGDRKFDESEIPSHGWADITEAFFDPVLYSDDAEL